MRDRDEVERRGEHRRVVAARDRRVQQARAVEVGGDAVLARRGADAPQLGGVPDHAPGAVLGVLDLDERRRREDEVAARLDRRDQLGGGEEPARPDLRELHARVRGAGAGLVPHGVRLATDDDLVAGVGQELQRELVGHVAGRNPQGGLLAEQRGDDVLQEVDGGVLAELIVADRRGRHGGAHRVGGLGDGVRAQVDGHPASLRRGRGVGCPGMTSPGGYWPRPWTCEDGGPRRLGAPQGQRGLAIGPGEHLELSAVRDAAATGMLIRREPGELFALRHELPRPCAGAAGALVGRAPGPADARDRRREPAASRRAVLARRHGRARVR